MIQARCVMPLYEIWHPMHPAPCWPLRLSCNRGSAGAEGQIKPCHQALHVLEGSAERLLRFDALRQCCPAFGVPERSCQPGVPYGGRAPVLPPRAAGQSTERITHVSLLSQYLCSTLYIVTW